MTATPTPSSNLVVGQTTTITVVFGPLGQPATIDSVLVNLECANAGGCATACNVPAGGPALSYEGDGTILNNTCGVAIASNHPGGSAPPTNQILFTFTPAINLNANQTCGFSFDVTINDLSGDLTAKVITGTAQTQGECQNGLPLAACGSYLIGVVEPDISITKTADPLAVCPGDEVTYTYLVENTGNGDLENVVVTDDNGTPGDTGDDFNPNFVGGDTGGDGILSPGEVWTYTATVNIFGDTTNIATVTADFISALGPVQVSDEDDATVTSSAPFCKVTPELSEDCPQVFRAFPQGGRAPYTVIWRDGSGTIIGQCDNVPDGGFCDSPSLDETGTYCASVIDANGCGSEDPCCGELICEPPGEPGGCTPGFWRHWHHFGHWPEPYIPHASCGTPTLYCDVFNCSTLNSQNVFGGKTLLEVVWTGGGGLYALGRHSVAALLNAAHPDVDYEGLTEADVIQMVNDAIASRNNMVIIATKNVLEALNEAGCPLGGQLFCAVPADLNEDAMVDSRDLEAIFETLGKFEGKAGQTQRDLISHVIANWGAVDAG